LDVEVEHHLQREARSNFGVRDGEFSCILFLILKKFARIGEEPTAAGSSVSDAN
jgi:hypothetical protein